MSRQFRAISRSVRASQSHLNHRRRTLRSAAVEALEARQLLSHSLTITTSPTSNVSFNNGTFTATADNANLNVTDLQNALVNGDTTVFTGSDGTQAGLIFWLGNADLNYAGPDTHTLSLDAGSDSLGGIHLLSNINASAPLNIDLSSAGVVDVAGTASDSGANVSITANSFDFSNGAAQMNLGSGAVNIQSFTAGRSIDIGQGNTAGDLNLRSADLNGFVAGSITIGNSSAGPVTVTSNVQQASDANVTVISSGQILIPSTSSWTTNHGSLTLIADQQVARTGGSFNGIYLNGGKIVSNDGAVLLQGTSGAGGGAGVVLDSAASITTTSGNITLQGGGIGDGIDVIAGSTVSAGGGANMSLTGAGGSTAGDSGVVIGQSTGQTTIAIGQGQMSIIGSVASGAAGNRGVFLATGAMEQSSAGGSIQITGTASTADTPAVFFDSGSFISGGTASMTITGDTLHLGDFRSITGSGSLTLQPLSQSRNIVIGPFTDVPGTMTLTVHDFNAIVTTAAAPGAAFIANLTIGRGDGTGSISAITNGLTVGSTITLNTPGAGSAGINISTALNSTSAPLNAPGLTLNSGSTIATSATGVLQSANIALNGATGVGSLAAPVSIRASAALTASAATGGIYITNLNSNALRLLSPGINDSVSGDIQLINPGQLTLDATNFSVNGHGNILLQTSAATADIRLGQSASVNTTNGTVSLQSGRDILVGTTGFGTINNSGTGNAGVSLTAARDILVEGVGLVNAAGTGTITANAARNLQIIQGVFNGARIWSQSGAIQLSAGAGGNFTLDGNASLGTIRSTIVGSGADITISADTVNLTSGDTIQAGTGIVTIKPVSAGRKIDLGSTTDVAANTMELSNAELSDVTSASVLRIGAANSDGLNISAAIAPPAALGALSLLNGGAITEAAGGSLTVSNLAIRSNGPDALASVNAVGTLAAQVSQSLQFNNGSTPLAIGVVDSVTGVVSTSGNVEIDADALDVQQQISAAAGTVTLAQSTAGTSISLGAEVAGQLSLTDAELANVTTTFLQLGNSASGDLFTRDVITPHAGFNTLSLQSGGRILGFSAISVASLSTVSAGNTFMSAPNTVGTYAAQISGSGQTLTFQNAQNLNIGTVGGIAGITTSDGNVTLNVDGNLTINSNIAAGAGAITLNPSGDVTTAVGTKIGGRSISQTSGAVLSTYAGTLDAIGSGISLNATMLSIPGNLIVENAGGVVTLTVGSTTPSMVSGVISGAGRFSVSGAGVVDLTGANTYTGTTTVGGGTLQVDGSLASLAATLVGGGLSAVTLTGAGTLAGSLSLNTNGTVAGSLNIQGAVNMNGGTFSGTGTVGGQMTVFAGTVSPGSPIGAINTAGLSFSGGSYAVDINGNTPGNGPTNYDQILGTGDVSLAGVSLRPTLRYVPANGDTFTILQTTGNITGQFTQGSSVLLGSKRYLISYNAHSVVLGLSADLSVNVSAPATVTAGGNVQYTITVTNNGPSDATNVVVTDTLPTGETFLTSTPGSTFNSPNQVIFNTPSLASGAFAVYTINARVSSSMPTNVSLTDSATATSDIPDAVSANNTGSASSSVTASADVLVAPNAPLSAVEAGSATFKVVVHNNGPSDAQNVVVTVPIPAGSTFLSVAQVSGPGMSFTAPAVGASSGNVTATIATLGAGLSGSFNVTLTAVDEGPLTLLPTIGADTPDPNSANNSGSATVTVADAPITVARTFGQPFPNEGANFATDLATISDANPMATTADFNVNIDWGDGTTSAGVLSQPGGAGHLFTVSGSHAYSEEGNYNVNVTVLDDGGSTGSTSVGILVPDAPLTSTGATINVTQNQSFTTKVASFTDANPNPEIDDFIAVIKWGDNTVSDGLIVANNSGGFDVMGTHTYSVSGPQQVVVTIHDSGSGTVAHTTANVAPPANTQSVPTLKAGSTRSITVKHGVSFTAVLGSFTDSNKANTDPTQYSGAITWGDGTTSTAHFTRTAAGKWNVTGTHTYKNKGHFTVHITLKVKGGKGTQLVGLMTVN